MWQQFPDPLQKLVLAISVLGCVMAPSGAAASAPRPGTGTGTELGTSASSQGPTIQAAALMGTVSAGFSHRHLASKEVSSKDPASKKAVPLRNAGVYAYRVTDLTLHKAQTDQDGGFSFAGLPAGIYKVIAHKAGFLPAVVMVTRTTANALQVLQLELFPSSARGLLGTTDTTTDFWEIRKRIPVDVLRDIQVAALDDAEQRSLGTFAPSFAADFNGKVHALTGSGRFANGSDATLVGGNIDITGHLGDLDLGIVGNFRTLRTPQAATLGTAQSLALRLDHSKNGSFNVSSQAESIATGPNPIDLERYRVRWDGNVGAGHSAVSANYTNEENYYRDPRIDQLDLPTASRTLDLAGSYSQRLGERTSVETGIKYRRRLPLSAISAGASNNAENPSRHVEWYGVGENSLRPSVALQYGLFTTFHNGAVAFSPQAGISLELPSNWTAETSLRQQLHQTGEQPAADFQPAHYGQQFQCTSAERSCFKVNFSRSPGEATSFEVGALYRRFADTLRLYFTDNLFDDLDSLFFVDGDQLPELHVGFSRRLSANVLAGFSTNLARGGGGTLAGGLENRVRYLVTSLNADFERSQTGLVLSFHSLNQRLLDRNGADALDPMEKDRLQLLLTQGLSRFIGFAPALNLILDMQISRSPQRLAEVDDEISRRILGGVALRF